MRRAFELLLGILVISVAWFALEFLAAPVFVIGAVVFVALDQVMGRAAAVAVAGTAAGVSFGLAPSWSRGAFWVAAAVCAALGFQLERLTGFLASQTPLDAGWAAFSLTMLGGPMLEALAAGPPAPKPLNPIRVTVFGVLGGIAGAFLAPQGEDPGPIAFRVAFALAHLMVCAVARRHVAEESHREELQMKATGSVRRRGGSS